MASLCCIAHQYACLHLCKWHRIYNSDRSACAPFAKVMHKMHQIVASADTHCISYIRFCSTLSLSLVI